jgi:hypothetical protein
MQGDRHGGSVWCGASVHPCLRSSFTTGLVSCNAIPGLVHLEMVMIKGVLASKTASRVWLSHTMVISSETARRLVSASRRKACSHMSLSRSLWMSSFTATSARASPTAISCSLPTSGPMIASAMVSIWIFSLPPPALCLF